jgi:hypothetical protein
LVLSSSTDPATAIMGCIKRTGGWQRRFVSHNSHRMRQLTLLFFLTVMVGCGVRVPEVPESARTQTPRGAPTSPWVGKGRLEVVAPGKRMSGSVIIRGLGDASVRAAFISDEGLLLADVSARDGVYTVNKSIADMERALPHLGRLVAHAYGQITESERQWKGGHLIGTHRDTVRWYGGDPILLRAVTGDGLDLLIEDYRWLGMELVPYEARAEGPFGITIRLRLQSAEPK